MNNKTKFCILTSPRSGSTWLSSLLKSHPQIQSFGEAFLWRKKGGWNDKIFIRYYDYRQSNSLWRPWVVFKYLDILDNYQGKPHNAIGFKLMYFNILEQPEILLKFIRDRYRIIHLVRENHLDVVISKAIGRQFGVFHTDKTSSQSKQVILNTSSLIRTFYLYSLMHQIAAMFLKLMPLPVLKVTYESLKTNRQETLRSITDFLGVDSQDILFESELKRVNPGSYKEKIANYDQVEKTLINSKYAHFLQDS
jgi:LPS sulfotransferase NodH